MFELAIDRLLTVIIIVIIIIYILLSLCHTITFSLPLSLLFFILFLTVVPYSMFHYFLLLPLLPSLPLVYFISFIHLELQTSITPSSSLTSFNHSFIYSFIGSFVHSFIHWLIQLSLTSILLESSLIAPLPPTLFRLPFNSHLNLLHFRSLCCLTITFSFFLPPVPFIILLFLS